MMKQWGGDKKVHPIAQHVPVDVDFAFTKLLVQGETQLPPEQKKAIKAAAEQQFRFASRLSFRQMQKFQYLIDVDSNGTFHECCQA